MTIGIQAGGICAGEIVGLNFTCNFYQSSTQFDFLVCLSNEIESKIKNPQGDGEDAAGNSFSFTGVTDNRDFFNQAEEDIGYFHADFLNETPIDYSGIQPEERLENDCEAIFCVPACDEGFDGASAIQEQGILLNAFLSEMVNYKTAMNQSNFILAERHLDEASLIKSDLDLLSLTINNFELNQEFIDIVGIEQNFHVQYSYNSEILAALSKFNRNQTTSAIAGLNNITSKYSNFPTFHESHSDLIGILNFLDAKNVYNLNSGELNSLSCLISDKNDLFSRSIVKNILTHHEEEYAAESCDLDFAINRGDDPKNTGERLIGEKSQIRIVPNPVSSRISLLSDKSFRGIIEIYSSQGTRLITQTINDDGEVDLNWLVDGIYFYRLIEEGVVLKSGKIIKTNNGH